MPKASRSPSVDRVATDLKRQGRPAKFIYVTPNFQNPAGLLMSAERRRELLDAARRHDLVILEDDPYGSIYFEDVTTFADTRPIKADDTDDRVIYLGSFSKILVPGLRVAWMVAPPAIAQKVELCKQAADISSGVFDQRIVHGALAGGVIDRIAPGLRAHYQAKRTVMERALESHLHGQREMDLAARRFLPLDRAAARRRRSRAVRSRASRRRSASSSAARSSSTAPATNSRASRSPASATNRSSRASPGSRAAINRSTD